MDDLKNPISEDEYKRLLKISPNKIMEDWNDPALNREYQEYLAASIVSLASARRHDLENSKLFEELLDHLVVFVELNNETFSNADLVQLYSCLERVYSFQKLQSRTEDLVLCRAKDLQTRIQTLMKFAPSKVNTVATSNVGKIYNALYTDMTQEEVRTEFARLFVSLNGEEYERRLKKKKREKKKLLPTGSEDPTALDKKKDGDGEDKTTSK